jgi:hypothetical protein
LAQRRGLPQVFRIRDGLITHLWLHGRRETALKAAGLDGA